MSEAVDDEKVAVLAIVGPTGVGKTALAVALAREYPIEAVSVDSRQVYRRMDIGTGKPDPLEQRSLRHHLLDVVEPGERYDAARFAREAATAIGEIRRRGRGVVLVGGTGLYLRALARGLAPAPPADLRLRRQIMAEARASGRIALHGRLTALDPETAARLHPRDLVRVARALEIVIQTGEPVRRGRAPSWRVAPSPYRVVTVGLTMSRAALYARLDARVDRMLAEGLLAEVAGLLAAGFGPELPAMQGIGYRHLAAVLAHEVSLAEAVHAMKRDTRRYAKRQWTWFGRDDGVHWITIEPADLASAIVEVKKVIVRTGVFDYSS